MASSKGSGVVIRQHLRGTGGLMFSVERAGEACKAFRAIRRFDAGVNPRAGGLHFLGAGFALWLCWQITNVVGYFAGRTLGIRK